MYGLKNKSNEIFAGFVNLILIHIELYILVFER